MNVHALKTWPAFYEDVALGTKSFEVRRNDRNFAVNDVLLLHEWQPDQKGDGGRFTGRLVAARVTYVLRGPILGIAEGWCVMGIKVV